MTSFRHALDHAMLMPFFLRFPTQQLFRTISKAPRRRRTRHEICIQMSLSLPMSSLLQLDGLHLGRNSGSREPPGPMHARVWCVCVCVC